MLHNFYPILFSVILWLKNNIIPYKWGTVLLTNNTMGSISCTILSLKQQNGIHSVWSSWISFWHCWRYISGCIRPPKSQWEAKKYEKHQFAMINHNIFMKINRFTCLMTKSVREKISEEFFRFYWFLELFQGWRSVFWTYIKWNAFLTLII